MPPRPPRLRVLAVIDGLDVGGAQRLLVNAARRGSVVGLDLEVVGLAGDRGADTVVAELEAAGVRVHDIGTRGLTEPATVLRLVHLIRRSGADLVHAHLEYAATFAVPAARLAGRPVICTFHHVPGPLPRREAFKESLAVMAAGRGDAVITVSEAQRHAFAARYRVARGPRWRTIVNGIELAPWRAAVPTLPDDLRVQVVAATAARSVAASGPVDGTDVEARRSPADLPPVTALVARLERGKGHDLALTAWRSVLDRDPRACLLVVGDGPLAPHLARRIEDEGLTDRVFPVGVRDDVARILAGADLAVLPSDSEALPTTLIEAAAAGTAVVATAVGGVPEVVKDGRSGLLVPPADPVAFADAVVTLLTDTARRDQLGRYGRDVVAPRFDVDRWVGELAGLYREVSGRGDACRAPAGEATR